MDTSIEIKELAQMFDAGTCEGHELKPGMFASDAIESLAADLQVLLDSVDTDACTDEPGSAMNSREFMFLSRLCKRMRLVSNITAKLNAEAYAAEHQAVAQ